MNNLIRGFAKMFARKPVRQRYSAQDELPQILPVAATAVSGSTENLSDPSDKGEFVFTTDTQELSEHDRTTQRRVVPLIYPRRAI